MKFLEDNFAVLFGSASNVATFLITRYLTTRERKATLEGRYSELLDKYVEMSNKYIEIIDKISEIEIVNHKLKIEIEQLTLKQCTQCQQK